MNILYYTWQEIISDDIFSTLVSFGFNVTKLQYKLKNNISDSEFIKYIENMLDNGYDGEKYDCILRCNFLPVLSKVAWRKKIKYVSWCYDSPCMTLYSDMIYNPYNYIFHFDGFEAERLKKSGVEHAYHMPLAVNCSRVNELISKGSNEDKICEMSELNHMNYKINNGMCYDNGITFMGSMYNSISDYDDLYGRLDAYLKGRFDAILGVNNLFTGMDLLDELVNEDLMKEINKIISFTHIDEYHIGDSEVVKNILSRKISGNDRMRIVKKLAEKYKLTLYTTSAIQAIHNVCNKGALEYLHKMPVVFHNSKININLTLRCIRKGIPLRALDIMGAGGFLLSDYQQELDDLFVDGEDMVLFYNDEDMLNKIEYYLNHDKERCEIAANGHRKVMEMYDYKNAWEKIFGIVKK